MSAFAISLQRLKPIRGWKSKILQPHGCVDCIELHKCPLLDFSRELPHELAVEDPFGVGVAERFNHAKS
jgi:hypothetical protein